MKEADCKLRFDIFTLFPAIFSGFLAASILRRAQDRGLLQVALHDIRAYAALPHRVCDGTPYGGGGGMVLRPEPIFAAVEAVLGERETRVPACPILLLTPQGRVLTQAVAEELSQYPRLALICGRYEGVDERVRQGLVTDEISIGDYVLGGGEVAAMVVIETVSRLLPGVLGFARGIHQDSHSQAMDYLLEGPQYTRPSDFRGMAIPEILLSGHHAQVARWRRTQSLLRTARRRPDLLRKARLDAADRTVLQAHGFDPDALS